MPHSPARYLRSDGCRGTVFKVMVSAGNSARTIVAIKPTTCVYLFETFSSGLYGFSTSEAFRRSDVLVC